MIRIAKLSVTEWWMLAVGVGSLLVELSALIWRDRLPVITKVMREDGCRWVLWPFILGFVTGHIYSPAWFKVPPLLKAQPYSIPVIAIGVLLFDLFGPVVSVEVAFFIAAAALPLGALLWNTAP